MSYRFLLTQWFAFVFYLSCVSCRLQGSGQPMVVEGDLSDVHSFLEGKTLYLEDIGKGRVLDSSVVQAGKFRFSVVSTGVPLRVRIGYKTGDRSWPYQLLGYLNPFLERISETIFYVEPGVTYLEKDTAFKPLGKDKIGLRFVEVRPQTEVAFKHRRFSHKSTSLQSAQDHNRALVTRYPYSIHLLYTLNETKYSLPPEELAQLLPLFDEPLHNSQVYKNLMSYATYQQAGSDFPTDIVLKKIDNTVTSAIIDHDKYNLIVFWASWCGSCRQEIPQLKDLHTAYQDKLAIISISIDKRADHWRAAVQKENMPWPQYLVEQDNSFAKLDRKYKLNAIPVWLLFDVNNTLLDHGIGMDEGKNALDSRIAAIINTR